MAALIADTSPMLRKIPSDPAADRRSFGFSPQSPTMSFARYLAEGRQTEQGRQQSPNPRSYTSHQTPTPYPCGYGYNAQEAFPYEDPEAPARITPKSCRCQRECTCAAPSAASGPCRNSAQPDSVSSMWHKDKPDGNAVTSARQGLFNGDASSRSTSVKPSATSTSARLERDVAEDVPRPSKKHKSDWENLLGAVDLELRAQKRAECVPEMSSARQVSPASSVSRRHPLHPSAGDNLYRSSSAAAAAAGSGSPEFGPYKPTHRRGGDGVSGGGPAYSGSTADAACLLATLPQRMLDRVSMTEVAPKRPPRAMPSMPLVSPPQTGQGQPLRVQASGRRGPRGQSRFKGVCITRAGKWRAVIYIGRKQKYLGVFDSEYDAARAYDTSALQHFAEGAKLNFPDGIEQQLHNLSSSGNTQFPTAGAGAGGAGAGGSAAARSSTPPALDQGEDSNTSTGRKRNRKSTFGDSGDDGEWIRDDGSWNSSRR